jgi:hypothetical protein
MATKDKRGNSCRKKASAKTLKQTKKAKQASEIAK